MLDQAPPLLMNRLQIWCILKILALVCPHDRMQLSAAIESVTADQHSGEEADLWWSNMGWVLPQWHAVWKYAPTHSFTGDHWGKRKCRWHAHYSFCTWWTAQWCAQWLWLNQAWIFTALFFIPESSEGESTVVNNSLLRPDRWLRLLWPGITQVASVLTGEIYDSAANFWFPGCSLQQESSTCNVSRALVLGCAPSKLHSWA